MPELPEVETIVRSLEPALTGRKVVEARFLAPRVLRGAQEPDLAGQTIHRVGRRGKFIVLEMDRGMLAIHLGMTGKLLIDGTPTRFLRAELVLDTCKLLFDDIRQFGRMLWSHSLPESVSKLGPEPLEITAAEFVGRLRSKRGRVKALLMNQTFLRGLGNIYTDEALFRAGIHPKAQAARLSKARAGALHAAIVQVLGEAIEGRGSSISDYVDTGGEGGSFQQKHRVYGREGKPCVVCGTPIRRIVVGQRGTHFCPRCQRY